MLWVQPKKNPPNQHARAHTHTHTKHKIHIQAKTGLPGGSGDKESACNAGHLGFIPGLEDPLEKEMATHTSILAWRIPWTEELDGLQSTGSQRIGHD